MKITWICEFTETWAVTQRDIKGHRIKSRKSQSTDQYDWSFSFASTAHTIQWSNYLTERAEILTRRSNLTPRRSKKPDSRRSRLFAGFVTRSLPTKAAERPGPPGNQATVEEYCEWFVCGTEVAFDIKQVGFTLSSLLFPRPAGCSRHFTPNRSIFAQHFSTAE